MLFKVEPNKPVVESNPEIANFSSLSECTDRELRWIFFVFDYETPLRKIPYEERIQKAADIAGFKREPSGRLDKNARETVSFKIPRIRPAVNEFMGLQYDQEQELLSAYNAQIDQAIQLMKKENKSDKEWMIVDRTNKMIQGWIKSKKDLELTLGYRSEQQQEETPEDEPLSTLDMLHIEEDE